MRKLIATGLALAWLAGCGLAMPVASSGSLAMPFFGHPATSKISEAPGAVGLPAEVAKVLAAQLSSNNRIEIFPDRTAYPALERMLAGARHYILINVYSWSMDEPGMRIANLLARKIQEGVQVRVIVDPLGQTEAQEGGLLVPWLRSRGIETRYYDDKVIFPRGLLHFSHRKLYVVDGDRAMVGGMNIGYHYEQQWHDLLVQVVGESANQIQREWLLDWRWSKGGEISFLTFRPRSYGKVTAVAIATSPNEPGRGDEIRRVRFAMINGAKRRIWCSYPYWGDRKLVEQLGKAAARGVAVRVFFPYDNDVGVFKKINRFVVKELLSRGVKVRWWVNNFAHGKYLVVDDILAVGSANADTSSLQYQQELDLLICDLQLVADFVNKIPAANWLAAREVVPEDLRQSVTEWPAAQFLNLVRFYL
ncbi:MAG: phosphatidylserine/phosphatidylglycerophosphate/cardiolipin synthase family protein [Cyanobacteria bacterium NC_groundwater_1444_Ag_S-0.65um_54_12]|nr:phosphatidylserine/phosphatidylglycerophosphate/cardiolipin synthase family protein [Cyanobacteria bacterium NC_groundwater_1444_Ag_S-0.65um_54_12]